MLLKQCYSLPFMSLLPSGSDQEGSCEANHELIRLILPKGSSFDDFTERCISDDESYQILIKEKS